MSNVNTKQQFLSLVMTINEESLDMVPILASAERIGRGFGQDYELIVLLNGPMKKLTQDLAQLCETGKTPNLQVFILASQVDRDLAAWAGIEYAMGDLVAVLDPSQDDIDALPNLLEKSQEGYDVVLGINTRKRRQSLAYRFSSSLFSRLGKKLLNTDPTRELPFYRVLTRNYVNFMLRHRPTNGTYRWLPAQSGYKRTVVHYESNITPPANHLLDDIDRGLRLLVSSTYGPMRAVTFLTLFGAVANLLYSLYVIVIALLKDDIAPGWVTMSLQNSGMFFLFSLVLLVLGEYVLHMAKLASNAPSYDVLEEYTSTVMTRTEQLNVEHSSPEELLEKSLLSRDSNKT